MSVTIWLHILRSSCASVASSLVNPFRGRLRAAMFMFMFMFICLYCLLFYCLLFIILGSFGTVEWEE